MLTNPRPSSSEQIRRGEEKDVLRVIALAAEAYRVLKG